MTRLSHVWEVTSVKPQTVRMAHRDAVSALVDDAERHLALIRTRFMLLDDPSCFDAWDVQREISKSSVHRAELALAYYAARAFETWTWGVSW